MRLLLISEGYGIGGTSRVISKLAEIFTENDIYVDILVPNYRHKECFQLTSKADLHFIAKDESSKNKLFLAFDLIRFWFKLIELSRKNNYQYVISFWNYINFILILTPLSSKKIVCSHISFSSLKTHWKILTRIIYPFSNSVVVLNTREKYLFEQFCNQVSVIENPLSNI